MKKPLCLLVFAALACISHAQTLQFQPFQSAVPQTGIKKWQPQLIDTVFAYKNLFLPQSQAPAGSMPNAFVPQVKLTYQGNNGNGLDIYQANIDNMYVVKPDSTFYSPGSVILLGSKPQVIVVP